jgi:GNAT superfamily N-acetyltransferase
MTDDAAGESPSPPMTFDDREGRTIVVRHHDHDRDREALTAMYEAFDPADRAQGIPPTTTDRIVDWLDTITGPETVNVVAWHGDDVVGHATLVPDDENGTVELAIFVLQSHQSAGVGTQLIRALLGAGRAAGFERVWLTVERWNAPAISLYEKMGFDATDTESLEHEMELDLTQTDNTG